MRIKSAIISSSEYDANGVSIFIARFDAFLERWVYYGEDYYPKKFDYPQEIEAWDKKYSSDTDRGFVITELELSTEQKVDIQHLDNAISALEKLLVTPTAKFPPLIEGRKTKGRVEKRSIELADYWKDVENARLKNNMYDGAIWYSKRELRTLLFTLIKQTKDETSN